MISESAQMSGFQFGWYPWGWKGALNFKHIYLYLKVNRDKHNGELQGANPPQK